MLGLAARLARRELRAGTGGFRILIASLALGVATICAVGTVSESVRGGLAAEGRRLLGGDVELRLVTRPPGADEVAFVRANAAATSQMIEMRGMAGTPAGNDFTLVELKAVDDPYPLVGQLTIEPAQPLSQALQQQDGVWGALAEPAVLRKLGLAVGDRVRVGAAEFRVAGSIQAEPDQVASVFNYGPRLMIAWDALATTDLIQPGSQVQYHIRATLPPTADRTAWIERLNEQFPTAGWRVRTMEEAAPGIRRFVDRMAQFLTFIGLTALLVGGIGVANAVRSYLDEKTRVIATLKCIGAPSRLVFLVYLLQVSALSAVGLVIGLVVGATLPLVALNAVASQLPVPPVIAFFPKPVLIAGAFGALIALTFAFWPLIRARAVPAQALYRDLVAHASFRPGKADLAWLGAGVLGLAGLTVAAATERNFAYWFVGISIATLVILRLAAWGAIVLAARFRTVRSRTVRQALSSIARPGTSAPSIMVSLGLGLAVLVAIGLIEGNMSRQIDERLPDAAPAFFFLDIQGAQAEAFDAAIKGVEGTSGYRRVPTLRGRIVAIKGVPVESAEIDRSVEWATRGDRAFTVAAVKPDEALLVNGQWWPADHTGPALLSLDAELARGFGLKLGDQLTINALGREITASLANTREIDWRSLRFDFALIFSPNALAGAPFSHIAAVQAPVAAEQAIERASAQAFPNVAVMRVRDALEAAERILEGIGAAVRSTAAITVATGTLVLAGAVAAARRRRIYDSVIFKVLGATRGTVLATFLVEYGILGAITSVIAALVGTATAWAVVVFLMEIPWVFIPEGVAFVLTVCMALTLAIGFVGTWRAMGQKAAGYLRND